MIISWHSREKVTSEEPCRTIEWNIAVKYSNGTEDLHHHFAGKSKGTTEFRLSVFLITSDFQINPHLYLSYFAVYVLICKDEVKCGVVAKKNISQKQCQFSSRRHQSIHFFILSFSSLYLEIRLVST